MKNKLFVAFLFAAVFGIAHSCTISDSEVLGDSSKENTAVNDQGLATRGNGKVYEVSPGDLEAYIHFKTLVNEKDTLVVKSILPFPNDYDAACYVINYEDNWEMISSDKRTAAVIASGEGEFDPDFETNKSIAWLSCLAEEIRVLKTTDEETKNSDKYQMFWKLITADKSLFKSNGLITRSGPDTLDHPVPGHYELVDVETLYNDYSIDHLIKTKWGQDDPFNQYCPIDSSYNDAYLTDPDAFFDCQGVFPHCLAGCVAVAGGQMVYYMYDEKEETDAEPFKYASCFTREYPLTVYGEMHQWNKSTLNWTDFHSEDSTRMAAVMLANIGKNSQMVYYGDYINLPITNEYYYYPQGSRTALINLSSALSVYNTGCFFSDFALLGSGLYDYIEELLTREYPSIIDAGVGDSLTNRHAFIVDRYSRHYAQYNFCYMFIPDDPNISPYLFEEVLYSLNGPGVTYFGMNWGICGQFDGTWCIKSGDWYMGNLNYNDRVYVMTFDIQGDPPGPGILSNEPIVE